MDAKYWMEPEPKEPSVAEFFLAREVTKLHQARGYKWEYCAFVMGRSRGISAKIVSARCLKVKRWVQWDRRQKRRMMSEDELRAFRENLAWTPCTAVWHAFRAFMLDRKGEWDMRLSAALGAYDAAQAAMAGHDVAEFLEACAQARRLCEELPPEWDPRESRTMPRGVGEAYRELLRSNAFRRYVG